MANTSTIRDLANSALSGDSFVDGVEHAIDSRLEGVSKKMMLKAEVAERRIDEAANVAGVMLKSEAAMAVASIADSSITALEAQLMAAPEGSRARAAIENAIAAIGAAADGSVGRLQTANLVAYKPPAADANELIPAKRGDDGKFRPLTA